MMRAVTTAVAGTTVRVGRVLAAGSAVVGAAVRHLAVAARRVPGPSAVSFAVLSRAATWSQGA